MSDSWFDMTPVDVCADALANMVQCGLLVGRSCNIVQPEALRYRDLLLALEDVAGIPAMDGADWVASLRKIEPKSFLPAMLDEYLHTRRPRFSGSCVAALPGFQMQSPRTILMQHLDAFGKHQPRPGSSTMMTTGTRLWRT
jgi:hypothetical protein